MRVMVFFDLPIETKANRRSYSKFRKFLLTDGFIMMQKSVYSKVVLNAHASEAAISRIRVHKPPEGVIQVLVITERQFQGIEFIIGEAQKTVIDTQSRLVIL